MKYLVVHLSSYQPTQLSETVGEGEEQERVATPVLVMEIEADSEDDAIREAIDSFERYAPIGNVAVYEFPENGPYVQLVERTGEITLSDVE